MRLASCTKFVQFIFKTLQRAKLHKNTPKNKLNSS